MRIKNIVFSFCLLGSCLCACSVPIEVEVPFPGPAIVVNSQFTPDSLWSVHLTKSKHILEEHDYLAIGNAQVLVYENGKVKESLELVREGYYRAAESKPLPGKTYKLKVIVPELGEVHGEDLIPDKVAISSGNWRRTRTGFDEEYLMSFVIDDPGGVDNFYMLEVFTYRYIREDYHNVEKGEIPQIIDSVLRKNGLETNDPGVIKNWGNRFLFSDALFDGEKYPFRMTLFYDMDRTQEEVYLVLRSLSKTSYEYWKTLEIQRMDNVLSEPMPVYGNIIGGHGLFGGYSIERKTIKMGKESEEGTF